MDLWEQIKWQSHLNEFGPQRGLYLRFAPEVHPDVKRSLKRYARWLRISYNFPSKVIVYVKHTPYIIAMDHSKASATFFWPYSFNTHAHIRIAVGDYLELKQSWGQDNALASILSSLSHELTHYFQWINEIKLTDVGYERQAISYAHKRVKEYAQTCDHP